MDFSMAWLFRHHQRKRWKTDKPRPKLDKIDFFLLYLRYVAVEFQD